MRRNSQKKHLRLGTEIQGSYDFSVSSAVAFHFPMRFKTQSGQLLVGSAGHLRMSVLCFLYFYFYCSFKQTIQLKDEPCGLFNSFFFLRKTFICALLGKENSQFFICLCIFLPFTLHWSWNMSNSHFQKCQTYFTKGSGLG